MRMPQARAQGTTLGMHGGEDPWPVLKYIPADFLVRENIVVRMVDEETASFRYLLLRKQGLTTFEAVGKIAEFLGLPRGEVTYAGLKDEDGITEQLIAIPYHRADAASGIPHPVFQDAGDRWVELRHYGHGIEPVKVGQLEGNSFRIVVRNLSDDDTQRLAGRHRLNLFFINYYDTQRFGVPGGPKLTHSVGAGILSGEWDQALATLIRLRAPESRSAEDWPGSAQQFFAQLDPRVVSFYLAAQYTYDNCAVTYRDSQRPTVTQASVLVAEAGLPDEFFPGRKAAVIRFALPSGSYATAAVRQLFGYLRRES
jgi:tRNA pseudouridine13 synthase